jgi:hypothetical protein
MSCSWNRAIGLLLHRNEAAGELQLIFARPCEGDELLANKLVGKT